MCPQSQQQKARLLGGLQALDFQEGNGAAEWNRTIDLTLTKGMLYRLSYGSNFREWRATP